MPYEFIKLKVELSAFIFILKWLHIFIQLFKPCLLVILNKKKSMIRIDLKSIKIIEYRFVFGSQILIDINHINFIRRV